MTRRVAAITGGSGGIGLACAHALVKAGYRVVLLARREKALREAAQDANCEWLVADASDEASVAKAMRSIGRVNLVVHAAGVAVRGYLRNQPHDEWKEVITANLLSCQVVVSAALPYMSSGDRIVLISSTTAHRPEPAMTAYSAAKAGMNAFAQALAGELDRDGILVNLLTPGPVETPMTEALPFDVHALQPSDVGNALVWLDSLPPHVAVPEVVIEAVTRGPNARTPRMSRRSS